MKEVEDGDSQQLLWLVLVLTSILGSREQFDLWKLGALTLLSCSLGRRLNETLVYDHLMSLFWLDNCGLLQGQVLLGLNSCKLASRWWSK